MKVNPRVLVMREAVEKIVAMLALKNIRVTQSGTGAFVRMNERTGQPEFVNLPYLPDDASDELIDATQGFLDHEVGHLLFSDFAKLHELGKRRSPQLFDLVNILEDCYIEREMARQFRGSAANLAATGKLVLDKIVGPFLADPKNTGMNRAVTLLMPMFRGMSGQSLFSDFLKPYEAELAPIRAALGPDFPELVRGIRSTADSVKVAEEFVRRVGKESTDGRGMPIERKPGEKGEGKDKGSKPKESKGEKGKDEGDDSTGERGTPDKDASKAKKGAKPGDDAADDEAGEGEPADDAEDEGDPAGSEGKEDDERDGEGDPDDSGDEGDADGDDGESDDAKGSDKGGDADRGDDTGDDEAADPGASDDDAGPEDEGEDESTDKADGDASGRHEASGDSSETPEGDAGELEAPERVPGLLDALTALKDYDELAEKAIEEASIAAAEHTEYLVWSTDFDKVEPLEVDLDSTHGAALVRSLQEGVDHMIAPMQKDVERAVAARSAAVWTSGHRSGRLHGASLARLAAGRDDVFRRKQENHTKDVAVELVIDASGSMSGGQIQVAAAAAYALSSTLDRLNIANDVVAFSTHHLPADAHMRMREDEVKLGRSYARRETVYMPILKDFNERMSALVRLRFATLGGGGGKVLANNIDGESVQYAYRRLMLRREARKVMIVLSDGEPCAAGDMRAQVKHLKAVVKNIEKSGTDVIGIGIESAAVERYYSKHVVLHDVAELPNEVMKRLKQLLVV
jgi:cobalamin biosynthesis protein CobT